MSARHTLSVVLPIALAAGAACDGQTRGQLRGVVVAGQQSMIIQ